MGFTTEAAATNAKAGSSVLSCEGRLVRKKFHCLCNLSVGHLVQRQRSDSFKLWSLSENICAEQ